ncbi:MAG: hypothetical protein JO116_14365 [Planctomycetaceae bacterium]|nr:hypothetical protein [Planctomycetaceae bacterium]MBV8609099.1 hypothetical protein [Singulisphaera sp.]
MLNRTNRTLSASLNRLNLGTRPLASFASLFNGELTLHTRHAYPAVSRDGMPGDQPWSLSGPRGEIAGMTDSPMGSSRLVTSGVIPTRVKLVVVSDLSGRSCRWEEAQEPTPGRVAWKRATCNCKSKMGLHLLREYGLACLALARAA